MGDRLPSGAPSTRAHANNFNVLRLAAALAVVVSHNYPIVSGSNRKEPFFRINGSTLGLFAVDAFFVISGFLVTRSLLTHRRAFNYLLARALRVYPALLPMLIYTLVIGAWLTTLPAFAFLLSGETWEFVWRNFTLIGGVQYRLPGLFKDNPYSSVVNGSLWTLPIEIWCYVGLLVLWLAAKLAFRKRLLAFKMVVVFVAIGSTAWFAYAAARQSPIDPAVRLVSMFAQGATYALLQEKFVYRSSRLLIVSMILAVSLLTGRLFYVPYSCAFPYAVLSFALLPSIRLRRLERMPDVSYGVYIYAFPTAQAVVSVVGVASAEFVLLLTTLASLGLAILSWSLCEAPFLRLKWHVLSIPTSS